jgi:hypothetical protein
MVSAELTLFNEDEIMSNITKEFKAVSEMHAWLERQWGHPFLHYRLDKFEEIKQ